MPFLAGLKGGDSRDGAAAVEAGQQHVRLGVPLHGAPLLCEAVRMRILQENAALANQSVQSYTKAAAVCGTPHLPFAKH